MAKYSNDQIVIKRLQSRFSNQEIAQLLDFKSASTVSRIASGKQRLTESHRVRAETVLSHHGKGFRKIRETPPRETQLKDYRKKVRQRRKESPTWFDELLNELFPPKEPKSPIDPDSAWESSTIEVFLDSIDVPDKDKLFEKLKGKKLVITYYNSILNTFLLSNSEINVSKFDINDVNYLLYYFQWEHTHKDGHVDIRNTFPIFPRYSFLGRQQVNTSPELLHILEMNGENEDSNGDEFRYDVLDAVEYKNLLAFVHQA